MALVPAMHHAASVTVRFALVCSSAISTNGSGLARLLSARNSTAHEPQRFAHRTCTDSNAYPISISRVYPELMVERVQCRACQRRRQRLAMLQNSSPYGIRGQCESMASNDEVMTGPSERDVHTFQRIQ